MGQLLYYYLIICSCSKNHTKNSTRTITNQERIQSIKKNFIETPFVSYRGIPLNCNTWTQLGNIQIDNYALGKDESVNFEECTLYVPSGTPWEYRHHPVFGQFKNIEIEKIK